MGDMKPPRVFISHASRDKAAADLLVDLFHIMGTGPVDVFCTSSPGFNIPAGVGFFHYIEELLNRSSLVVHLITPAFLQSQFCMLELGAAWGQKKSFLLLAPSLSPGTLKDSALANLELTALDSTGLDQLRDRIADLGAERPRTTGWAERRDRALGALREALDRSTRRPVKRLAALGVRGHHLEVWALNADRRITHSWWPRDGGDHHWNKPYDFNAPSGIEDLAAASRGPDHAEVFAIDHRGVLWHKWWRPHQWSGWHTFDQVVTPPIAACSYDDRHIEVFARDPATDSIIHSYSWEAGNWSEWVPLDVGLEPQAGG